MSELTEKIKSQYDNVEAIISGYSMTVIWASPNLHKLLGYEDGELIDISARKLIKISPASLTKMIIEALDDTASDTNKIVKKDGSEILLKTTAGVTRIDNEPYVVVTSAKIIEEL